MNKQMMTFFAAVAASCWMLGVNAAAAGDSLGRVDTQSSPLTVRTSASTSGKKVASLPKGSTVSLSYRTGDWWYVEYQKGRYGYCHADYITVLDEKAPSSSKSEKISLQVPDYKQFDSRWAKTIIGVSGQTMKKIGCTTVALADTESYRTGKSITPAQLSKTLSYTKGGAVYWPSNYQSSSASDYLSVILKNLKAGKPTIVGAKDASGKAHWVVVTGYDGAKNPKAANFLINDPGSNDRTALSELFSEYPYFYKLEYYK